MIHMFQRRALLLEQFRPLDLQYVNPIPVTDDGLAENTDSGIKKKYSVKLAYHLPYSLRHSSIKEDIFNINTNLKLI